MHGSSSGLPGADDRENIDRLIQRARQSQAAGDYDAAVRLYEAAVAAAPNLSALRHNLAASYRSAGRLTDAEAAFRGALATASDPMTRYAVGSALLSLGCYSEAWPLYEARYDVRGLIQPKPRLPFPEWLGEPVDGRAVAIFPEQGFGDQIQFARFADTLSRRARQVTLLCHPALERLFGASFGAGVDVVAAAGSVNFPDPDVWVTCTSLPARLGVTLDSLEGAAYLRAPSPQGRSPGAELRVGFVGRGSPHHRNDGNRSLTPGAEAILRELTSDMVDLDPASTGASDFADTADIVAGLDLVICVDTSVAHLAGAMGKSCWVLLPATDTDWRWLRERVDSPWYDSLKLYRQTRPGDWSDVLDAVRRDFAALSG